MFGRRSISLVAAGCTLILLAGQVSASTLADKTVEQRSTDVQPNLVSIDVKGHWVTATRCRTTECRALLLIAKIMRIDMDATVAMNGTARPIPPNRDATEFKSRNLALQNTSIFSAVCKLSTAILSIYSLQDAQSDLFTGVNLIELGVDMDVRNGGHCTQMLFKALPDTPEVQTAIGNAKTMCIYSRRYPARVCNAIVRP